MVPWRPLNKLCQYNPFGRSPLSEFDSWEEYWINIFNSYDHFVCLDEDFQHLWKEPFPSLALSDTNTFITNGEDGAIDNIVVCKKWTVGKGTMVDKGHSDHNMLYADITF